MASKSKPTQISPVRKWLLYVNGQIAHCDIPLLKLCLYPTFRSARERDEAKSIPDLFYAMKDSDNPHHQQAVLYAFICALKVIGGKRRGRECISELVRSGIDVPNCSEHEEPEDFHFFQCFARVARDVESDDEARSKICEAYGRRLERNYRNYGHVADMFKSIYEAQLVTPDDCTEFFELLQRCRNGDKYSSTMSKYSKKEGEFF